MRSRGVKSLHRDQTWGVDCRRRTYGPTEAPWTRSRSGRGSGRVVLVFLPMRRGRVVVHHRLEGLLVRVLLGRLVGPPPSPPTHSCSGFPTPTALPAPMSGLYKHRVLPVVQLPPLQPQLSLVYLRLVLPVVEVPVGPVPTRANVGVLQTPLGRPCFGAVNQPTKSGGWGSWVDPCRDTTHPDLWTVTGSTYTRDRIRVPLG